MPVSVKVEQNVNRGVNFICAFLILLIVPILGLIRKVSFEGGRWKDSMFSSAARVGRFGRIESWYVKETIHGLRRRGIGVLLDVIVVWVGAG